MKRVIFTIFLSSMVLFQTGCDEIAAVLEESTGCMLQDASNYEAGAIAPCVTECLGDKTGANCCCEDIVYGCMDPAASNHTELASAPCSELINGVKVENACCISEVSGCTDEAANNYNALANKDDSSCTYDSVEVTLSDGTTASVTPGCMNADACNYVAVADADCNAENATISGSDWVQNDDCCNLTKNASCYLDLNNNGYYEEVNTAANLCNCRDLGVGWVSGDEVAEDIEVQGCTSPTVNGQACVEYNPSANVDNGGCCQQEFSFEDYADFDESSLDFMGVFDVEFMMGMVDQAGECVMPSDSSMGNMNMGGPYMAQLTLGLPNTSGEGQLQYFEVYRDEMESRPEWEVRIPTANTEDQCFAYADSSGSDYSYCANWGHDYENCEDFDVASECPQGKCIWETKFCFPTFEGQPCPSYTNEYDCNENDCEWSFDGTCFTPIDEPWMHCWDLDEDECVQSPDCKLETGDNFGPGGGEGGPECMSDCPMYPDPDSWTQDSECTWLSGMVNTGCLSDCDMELSDMQDMLKMQYHIQCNDTNNDCVGFFDGGNEGGDCSYSCGFIYEDYCEYNTGVPSDFNSCCPGFDLANCPVEQQAPINQGALDECMLSIGITYNYDNYGGAADSSLCQGCNIKQLAYFYSDTTKNANAMSASAVVIDSTISTKPFCDRLSTEESWGFYGCNGEVKDLMYKLENDCSECATAQCYADVFGGSDLQTLDCTNATEVTSCSATTNETNCVCDPDCEWMPNAGGASGGTCKDFGSGDFVGQDGPACLSGDTSSGVAWDWSKDPEDDPDGFCSYLVGLPAAATDDCVGPEGQIRCEQYICEECLVIGDGMCDEIFGNDGEGMDMAFNKLSKVPMPEDRGLSRGSTCDPGYLVDCSGDGDCCAESWLGDGYADCADQEFGCDLSCYDNDGGDCEASFGESECVPSSPCFKAENQYQSACLDNPACVWKMDEFSMENHCEPKPSFNPNACGTLSETACGQDGACQWNAQAGPNDPANFQPHCGPKAPDNCFALDSQSACDASLTCEWEAPDWMPPWQDGVCYTNNPCMTPENSDPDVCDSKPECEWDWEYYECVEAGSGNDFCDCHVSLTAKLCNDIGGKWELPGWAMDCDDCYDIEKECMMPLSQQDCFDQNQYHDPCAEFYQGGNQTTSWENNKCVNENSFSDAGTWGLGDGCLELNWAEQPQPDCNDPQLQNEDKCYCFDCEWNDLSGDCVEWASDGMGRKTDQAKMRNFQEMIYQLSGSGSSDGDCLDYHMMDGGTIHLVQIDEEYGYCQMITLTPAENQ